MLALFLSGLARSLVALLVTAGTTPWVCCKWSIPSCVNGRADSSSQGSNYPSTTACIVGCTRGKSLSTKTSVDLIRLRTPMSSVDGPPESPSIFHVEPRPPSRITSTQLATPVDHRFARARYSLLPPRNKHRRGLSPVHRKRLPVHQRRWPVHPSLSPKMFEVVTGEFRWHLRSNHRGPRGQSGDTWAEYLLRWLKEGGATGRRRSRSRSSI